MRRGRTLIAVVFLVLAGCASERAGAADEGFVSLFNGKDLSGWEGDRAIWSVEDGAITGQTSKDQPIKENNYLVWSGGVLKDFELRLKYRLENGNSGIYCRAHRRAANEKSADPVVAWQADIDDKHEWTGTIMEWTVREKLASRGEKVVIDEKGKKTVVGSLGEAAKLAEAVKNKDWNEYVVTAKGGHIVLAINGVTMSELDDRDPRRAVEGLLALQVHVGPAMKVQYKDIRLKKL